MNITFLGLGIMGSRMATNLVKGGADVTVWNRTAAAADIPGLADAKKETDLNTAVANADVVFSMLTTPEVIAETFFGESGVLTHMQKDALWIDCTTVNPSFSRTAAEHATAAGIRFFDGPVAGSKPQAEKAQLAFFLGADAATVEPIKPYLEMMGAKVIPFGKVGQGAAFKMIVNMMLAHSMVVFSEAVHFGESLGIDKEFLLKVIPGLPVIAPFTAFKTDAIRNDDYEVNFPLEWILKDVHLAALTAYEVDQPLHVNAVVQELFAAANRAGMGRLDFAAIHRQLTPGQ